MDKALAFTLLVLTLLQSSQYNSRAISGTDGPLPPFGGNAEVDGNGNNTFPFLFSYPETQRYQQVYAASLFTELTEPEFITDIAFRRDALWSGAAFSLTLQDVVISFSTTSAGPDGLSTTFAANIGSDETVVHSGPLTLSSPAVSTSGVPRDFDIVISFQTPFLYDPTAGNLLMDVRRYSPAGSDFESSLDAHDVYGDGMSRVYTDGSLDVYSPVGYNTPFGSLGLVTQFTVTPVPEPTAFTLLGLGSLALGMRRRKP